MQRLVARFGDKGRGRAGEGVGKGGGQCKLCLECRAHQGMRMAFLDGAEQYLSDAEHPLAQSNRVRKAI
jgi:hypothetical protein